MPTLHAVQLDIAWEDKPATFARIDRLLAQAHPQPNSLIVLPEMFSTGFSMNVPAIREGAEKPAERYLQSLATRYRATVVGGVVHDGPAGKALNQALVFSPEGQEICRFDKLHPFSLGSEDQHYAPGRSIRTFQWAGLTVCPAVCYDLRFPEQFRAGVDAGAEFFLVIANWPIKRENHWLTLLAARAIENQAYVLGVNRAGADPKFTYGGRSILVDPHGVTRADAGISESVLTTDLDPALVRQWRTDFPALRDRTPKP
ncbi:MAG TPA: carbon-nitrogen family hydrolase [Tepidisphaeraceae bacterium]|nr:carbon-nitrogen family hydrolase [Tepidisphaeraceae bacterium]